MMKSFGQARRDIKSEEGSGAKVLAGSSGDPGLCLCGSPLTANWEDTNFYLRK